jgi:hypothetical protein
MDNILQQKFNCKIKTLENRHGTMINSPLKRRKKYSILNRLQDPTYRRHSSMFTSNSTFLMLWPVGLNCFILELKMGFQSFKNLNLMS